jgi:hypothetical protein
VIIAKHGIEVEHRVVPEGTGRMLDLLEEGAVDIALTARKCFVYLLSTCFLSAVIRSVTSKEHYPFSPFDHLSISSHLSF